VRDRIKLLKIAEDAGVPVLRTKIMSQRDDWSSPCVIKSRYSIIEANQPSPSLYRRRVGIPDDPNSQGRSRHIVKHNFFEEALLIIAHLRGSKFDTLGRHDLAPFMVDLFSEGRKRLPVPVRMA